MKVGAVILHYRFWPGIERTIQSLLAQTRPPDVVLVVDNGSNDGSAQSLRRSPGFELIEAGVNRGYGAGMNLGLEPLLERGMDAVLLLTHECLLAPDALERLVERLEDDPDIGAVGPLLAYRSMPYRVFSAGGEIDRRTRRPRHVTEPHVVKDWIDRPSRGVSWVDGAAILLRAPAVKAAGRLDEEYFLYFEETEYLLKLRRLGWRVECVHAAVAWQEPGVKPSYLMLRNRLRFVARTAPRRYVVRDVGRLTASVIKNSVIPNRQATPSQLRDRRRALTHFLMRRWGPDRSAAPSTDGPWPDDPSRRDMTVSRGVTP
jgi:GT2 family glycosyltransferase